MATGGSDVCESDEVFDHLCSVCKKKNISTEASVYCEDCKDYYCDKCVDVHKTVPALSDHVLLTASHGRKLQSLPTSKCDKHTKNVIDMYCQDDDEVGCIKSITVNHSGKCKKLHDITDCVKDNTNIVPDFIQNVKRTVTELKSRMNVFLQELTGFQQNKKHVTVTCPRLYRFSAIKTIYLDLYRLLYDSCCSTDGSVFFTNFNNDSIHRFCYKTLNVVESLPLSSSPSGVCCVTNSTIAVGIGTTIQMLDITGKLKLTDSIKVDHDILGLDYHDNIFYATSHDCVYKYERNGKLLKSYSKYPDGNNIFSCVRNLVVNPLDKHIHVADYNNGVITMNQEGHVLNVVKDNIPGPLGICVDQYGQVFVSGCWSNNIIQLSFNGRYITTVISEGLCSPQGICFDTTRGRLYIGVWGGNLIVYKVENVTE